jgi:hypothetical protein
VKRAKTEKWIADGVPIERLIDNVKVAEEALAVAKQALDARFNTYRCIRNASPEPEPEPESDPPILWSLVKWKLRFTGNTEGITVKDAPGEEDDYDAYAEGIWGSAIRNWMPLRSSCTSLAEAYRERADRLSKEMSVAREALRTLEREHSFAERNMKHWLWEAEISGPCPDPPIV